MHTCSGGVQAADLSVQDEFDAARRQGRNTESLLMDTSFEMAKVKRDNVLLMQQVGPHVVLPLVTRMVLPAMALPAMALPAMALPAMALPAMALPAMALPAMALPACHGTVQCTLFIAELYVHPSRAETSCRAVMKVSKAPGHTHSASTTWADLQARNAGEDTSNAQLTVVLLRQERDSLLQRLARMEDKVIASEGIFPVRETEETAIQSASETFGSDPGLISDVQPSE